MLPNPNKITKRTTFPQFYTHPIISIHRFTKEEGKKKKVGCFEVEQNLTFLFHRPAALNMNLSANIHFPHTAFKTHRPLTYYSIIHLKAHYSSVSILNYSLSLLFTVKLIGKLCMRVENASRVPKSSLVTVRLADFSM